MKINGHYVNGYVIMLNHLHALIGFSNSGKNINRIRGIAILVLVREDTNPGIGIDEIGFLIHIGSVL